MFVYTIVGLGRGWGLYVFEAKVNVSNECRVSSISRVGRSAGREQVEMWEGPMNYVF